MTEARGRRKFNKPWKHIYGVDRGYTARVDRVRERQVGRGASRMTAPLSAQPGTFASTDEGALAGTYDAASRQSTPSGVG